ncbi:hypothetical protein [Promicromonospora iranensis]|jgi:hypothetical protein|uniref:hypothetical protein n=1 Tax=Promicromonospora iranensis TaxID=1105144 RepID=UPI0023AA0FB6|nr:hypothetical protein [Promicromonospora iranensis]
MAQEETMNYLIPVTFPDLAAAKSGTEPLVDTLRAAGIQAEIIAEPGLDSEGDGGRPDPGPTTRELHVHASSADEARRRVQELTDARFPAGMVLLGEPTRI